MNAPRRIGSTNSKTRALILDTAEQLMIEHGYAAVTSRSVAARADIPPGLVHYYFPTIDDLFVAVYTRGADKNLELIAGALASPEPLLSLWRLISDRRGVALFMELMAAANHREALHQEVAKLSEAWSRMQVEALRVLLPQYGIDVDVFTPTLTVAALQGVALVVARQDALGLTTNHEAAADAVEALLEDLERRRRLARGA